jgi:hypothetical protein
MESFDHHRNTYYSVEEPVGLVSAEFFGAKFELTAWGDGAASSIVDTPPQRRGPASTNGGLSQVLDKVRQGDSMAASRSGPEYMICVREYVFAWKGAGDSDNYTEVFERAKPYCSSLGLDSASAAPEDMEELSRSMQEIWSSLLLP